MLVLLTIVGLVIGSFINSFLWRYQTRTKYSGRSMCPICKHQINWYDNIPLVSWFLLSGKCRYCKKSISIQYPIVEAATGVLFVLVGLYSSAGVYLNHLIKMMIELGPIYQARYVIGGTIELLILLAIITMLIIIAIHDYKTKEIPNRFNLIFVLFSLAFLLVSSFFPMVNSQGLIYSLAAGGIAFSFFYALVYFSKETWMGGGDAKLAIGIGLFLGPLNTFVAVLLASWLGSIYGITIIAISRLNHSNTKIRNLKSEIPFGPFLALGTVLSFLFGSQLIALYVKIFLGF